MSRYFTSEHEWIEVEGEHATVGITDFAQHQLGDITFVETPVEGSVVKAGDAVAVVESVKAASDIYAPASGTITAGNPALEDTPELINTSAENEGWLFRMTLANPTELDTLMDAAAYQALVAR